MGGSVSPRDQVGGCLAAARPQGRSPAGRNANQPLPRRSLRPGARITTESGALDLTFRSSLANPTQLARPAGFKPVCSGLRACRRSSGAAWLPVENMRRLILPLAGLMGARATFGEGGRRARRLRPQILDQHRGRAFRVVPLVAVAMLVAVPVALVGMPVFGLRRRPVRCRAFFVVTVFVVTVIAEEEMMMVQASFAFAVHMVPRMQELRTQTEHRQRGEAPGENRAA